MVKVGITQTEPKLRLTEKREPRGCVFTRQDPSGKPHLAGKAFLLAALVELEMNGVCYSSMAHERQGLVNDLENP